ncbi:MAG TPA: helix-turn-helix domain-containing protein [Candidatus Micrarchaeaceae archaeon]|nr:helix-turn-helix domain-containing protein [Candidatus Micrarchaeaceae archaeon]
MVFGVIYSCLRLLLDLVDVRRRMQNPEAELLLLRHQLRVLRRQVKRPRLEPADRLIMAGLSRLVSREALSGLLVQPETVLKWHRELVRRKWAAFGSRRGPGRPPLSDEVRALILRMAKENRTWGCVRICGELIKVGHRVSITAIRNFLRKHRVPGAPFRSGPSWRAFLKAQASAVASRDCCKSEAVSRRGVSILSGHLDG